MPKFLRAVRLDDSDDHLFPANGAATEGEWVVSGGFAACDSANAPRCEPRCHCESSFLALQSRRRCSIAEVAELTDAELDERIDQLTWFLLKGWGAPSWEAARKVAEEEIGHTVDVCETLAPEVWITVRRTPRADGSAIEEQYSVYDRLLIGTHKL
jgi:Family of unknown function (DUF6505)